MRSQRGQAAIEYLALLAIVGLLIAAAGLAGPPLTLADTFGRTVSRALCIVRGGTCDADLRPCVVVADRRSAERHLNLVVVRYGKGRYLLRERRSDGTIALTDYHDRSGRVGGSRGAEIDVAGLSVGGEVRLGLMARWGGGAVYVARSAAEADRIERAIVADGELPVPSERFGTRATEREYGASGSVGDHDLVDAGFSARDADGRRVAADGSQTISYAHGEGWSVGVFGATRQGDLGPRESYAVRLDPAGRPLELVVSTAIELRDAGDLPIDLLPVTMQLTGTPGENRVLTVEAHLDLGDPANAEIARGFVAQLGDRRPRIGAPPAPAARLRRALREAGTIEARVHALAVEEASSADGLGLGTSVRRERSRLVAAASRSYDGRWRIRQDCFGG